MNQTPMVVQSLLPVAISTEILLTAMLLIISTVTFVYVFIYNYTQDWQMKTKHKQSVSNRVVDVVNRNSELEKIKQEEGDNNEQ